jgi:hypothetical protein
MGGRELRESVMNTYVKYNGHVVEIRPDRSWRWLAWTEPFELLKDQAWKIDEVIEHQTSWESYIDSGDAEIITLEQFVEENFENLL